MNKASLKARRMTYAAQRKYDRMGEANARTVDAIVVRAWHKLQSLIATTEFPNGRFQQRLRSILYDDVMARLIVTIRGQLEEAAKLGWTTGVEIHTTCVPREVWVKWARWKSGVREQFDPNQPRDDIGRWTDTGGGTATIDAQTETAAFKKWFGDSKVVDESGDPLVVYHATDEGEIDEFSPRKKDHWYSFTPEEWHARDFGETVHAVYLSLQNPLDLTQFGAGGDEGDDQTDPSDIASFLADNGIAVSLGSRKGFTTEILNRAATEIRSQAIARGFDGLKMWDYKSDEALEFVAFFPTQIKSATHNKGTFDPKNPKIKEARLQEMMMFRWAAKAISLVVDFAELIAGKELDEKSWLKRLKKIVFPPPSKVEVETILRSDRWPDRKTWPQRLQKEGLSFDSIVNQVSTSMAQGKNVKEITKDIEPLVNNVRVRARRIARTESIRVAQTMQRETDKHVDDLVYGRQILSVGDERVRPEHKERHGRIYYKPGWGPAGAPEFGECPETPDAPNCVLPGAVVSGQFVAGLKANYAGQAIQLTTEYGRILRVTPNHRVLTRHGFVAAQEIRQGNELICDSGVDKWASVVPDYEHNTPPAIENVFSSMLQVARPSRGGRQFSADAATFDFHGDERVCQGDVHVVVPNGELLYRLQSAFPQFIAQSNLVRDNVQATHESRQRASLLAAGAVHGMTTGLPGLGELPLDLGWALLDGGPLDQFSFGTTAYLNSLFLEPFEQHAATDASLHLQLLQGYAGFVLLDKVVEVRNIEFSGHVYDLQSTVGWYSCNGIITHNCRCTTYVLYKGIDQIGLEHLRFSPDFMPANVRQQQSAP